MDVSTQTAASQTKDRPKILREAAAVWVASVITIAALGAIATVVPFVSENLLAFVAATFLYLPAWVLWRQRRELYEYGFTVKPIGRGLVHFVLAIALTFPPFIWGWSLFQTEVKGNTVEFTVDRLDRFDRQLEGRPEFPLNENLLYVWVEREQLFLVWTGNTPIDLTIALRTQKGAPFSDVLGITVTKDGLKYGDRGRLDVKLSGEARWRRPNPGGISIPLGQVDAFTMQTTATTRTGRWAIATRDQLSSERSSWWWLLMWFNQLVLVALPEEWFFRGYLQKRLDEVWTPTWKIFGAHMGWAWIVSSLMFALGHLVSNPSPHRLAVFFPSLLFGWLRTRTDSIFASVGYHAACNVLAQGLVYMLV